MARPNHLKKVTYGKPASLAAPENFKEDAPSPKRPQKRADSTLSSVRATRQTSRQTSRNIFDVSSDNNEPTPRPSATPTKKAPQKDNKFDISDVPSSPPPISTRMKR